MKHEENYARFIVILALVSTACGGDDLECGPGTHPYGDRCVADVSSCGDGTKLVDGQCVPLCADNEIWTGKHCVPDYQCAPGTSPVAGQCVPTCTKDEYWNGQSCSKTPRCALGTVFDENTGSCVPNELICAKGTHLDNGQCVPDTSACGDGTHLENGQCVPNRLPAPDVVESTDPTGKVTFDLPDPGKSITLGGTVDTPIDLNGDSIVDADYDRFSFSAQAGTWIRVHATSEGAAHPAFALVSDDTDAQGQVLYARYAVNPLGVDTEREFYLPRSGNYTLVVSDYTHVTSDLFGWLALPVGGDDFTYLITVDNLGDPTPTPIASVPASKTGDSGAGALAFYQMKDLKLHDARVAQHMGKPSGMMASDTFGALMLFGPKGTLVRESLSYSLTGDATILFAATEPGDHLLVVDHLLSIGPVTDYELRVEQVDTVDCGAANCAAGTLAQGTSKLLYWDLKEDNVFAMGAKVPDTESSSLQVQRMDAGLVPVGEKTSASKYGPAKIRTYIEKDQRLYLLLTGYNGNAIASYELDVKTPTVDRLTSATTHSGLKVHEMPLDIYPSAGMGRWDAAAGQVILSTSFTTAWPNWTQPLEEYLTLGFEPLPKLRDTTDPAFPNSILPPLMAYMPKAGRFLYQTKDDAGGDIVGASYDTTFHALTPISLATPTAGNPVSKTNQGLIPTAGWSLFGFSVPKGQTVALKVTPKGTEPLQAEAWIVTPGRHQYTSGNHSWVADKEEIGLGILARQAASAPGQEVQLLVEAPYDDTQLVFIRNIDAGDPTGRA